MSYNLPNPSLVGIALAVSTHNGPQIVFHYPPEISKRHARAADEDARSDDETDEDYDEDGRDLTRDKTWDVNHPDYYLRSKFDVMTFLDAREEYRSQAADKDTRPEAAAAAAAVPHAPATGILGFEADHLGDMLCPPRAMCNRRFDVMLDNVVFLGLPVHVNSDGTWRARRQPTVATSRSGCSGSDDDSEPDAAAAAPTMSMFNLVFLMNPPDMERNYRVDEMFYNVVSKLALVLRYEQHKHDYVWAQVRAVSRLKDEWRKNPAEPLAQHLVARSPLCRMMADCYESIAASKIANLSVNNKLRSFQIPVKMEFHSLPETTVPYVPGAYLSSTASCLGASGLLTVGETTRYSNKNLMDVILGLADTDSQGPGSDDEDSRSSADDIIHHALLLWDDPEAIIRDIRADRGSAIAKFVRMVKPTESLAKIAARLKTQSAGKAVLDIAEIKTFAVHLVYWRRARVIPPLNTRAIYIVSPMAPIATNFHRDIARFNQQFPSTPSLPSFLHLLSSRSKKPRQFASIIPSKDHKDLYLLALAWLVRYGYVTQLHTYIWLKVSKKVKMKVEEELETELGRAPKQKRAREATTVVSVDNSSKKPEAVDAEADPLHKQHEAPSAFPNIALEDDGDTILVDPGRASSLERRWINKIIYDECTLSPELTAVFFKLLKYMNGKNSLELLLLRENVSRTDLRKLLSAIEDHIISVRHW